MSPRPSGSDAEPGAGAGSGSGGADGGVRTPRAARRARGPRTALAALAALGAVGSLTVGAAAGSAQAAGARTTAASPAARPAAGAPDLTGLRSALQSVVAAGSPGVFAQVSDTAGGGGTVSVGTGDRGANTPVDPLGQFRVGSITKNFTAVLVLQLEAQHLVDLDAPATGYLAAGVLPAGSRITVRELLNHTSGLYDYTNDLLAGSTIPGYQNFRYQVYDPADLVAQAVAQGSQFTPGSRYQYSNTNFVVLGLLVEHVTAEPYAQVLADRVLTPLGLTHTRFYVPQTGIGGPHANGYLTDDDRSKPMLDATEQTASWIWTAGAAISSTADLNAYWRALAAGTLMPQAQVAEMETIAPIDSTSGYGLGIRQYTLSCGVQVYGHDGIIEGYQTYSYTTKDGSRQLTVSANASNNGDVFAAERAALDPAFCGKSTAPAGAARHAAADSARIADEETKGLAPQAVRR
ncbi:serine hydrolase domain-containing protein [Streptomyces sp. V4-01]|uniref:Serine hydrolase domain-containing protein n=1 Tax=Actinacidiphila polyblastidii TaxID=3110430 RepID=A0ABU7P7V6_9ACTN|nr:serine hydrolase domain-containing protein [Streptomyces sp. V4-01]